jgi:DNA-binding CsgD family transcriptional regulator
MRLMHVAPEADTSSQLAHDVIGSIGRDDFVPRLLRVLQELLHADLISALVFADGSPTLLGHDTLAERTAEARAVRGYLSGCFREDPNSKVLAEELKPGATMVAYMSKTDVRTHAYRRLCYDEAHITDRLSVLHKTTRGEGITVNFYRCDSSGPFEPEQFDAVTELAPLLQAASVRHYELIIAHLPATFDRTLLRLTDCFPLLTLREAQCAAGVIAGLTADEIAARLGIKTTSVITHRKHAYYRLNVSGQRALIALYYAKLASAPSTAPQKMRTSHRAPPTRRAGFPAPS